MKEIMLALEREVAGARAGNRRALYLGAINWLHLAAAPTFAVMALVTAVLGDGSIGMLCSGGPDAPPLTGMVSMYVLMSVFHSAPWLRLIGTRAITPPRCAPPRVGSSRTTA